MASVLFRRSTDTHGKICIPCFACKVYTWKKNIVGHTLNVPSPNQGLEFEVNGLVCRDENATTIWGYPNPLSSFLVSLKVCSSTGIAAQFIGCGSTFLSCREARIVFLIVSIDGKLTAAVPVIPPSSSV